MRLEQYMKELNKVQLLSPEDEQALWQAFKEEGDTAARQRLIESYQPLVFKQAMPFAHLPVSWMSYRKGPSAHRSRGTL